MVRYSSSASSHPPDSLVDHRPIHLSDTSTEPHGRPIPLQPGRDTGRNGDKVIGDGLPGRRHARKGYEEDYKLHTMLMEQELHIPPRTAANISVQTSAAGPLVVGPHPNISCRRLPLPALGICDITPGHPFRIFITNFFKSTIHLPKHMMVVVTTEAPDLVVQLGNDDRTTY